MTGNTNTPDCRTATQLHSERRLITGFETAALIACRLTVINATSNAMPPEKTNSHPRQVGRITIDESYHMSYFIRKQYFRLVQIRNEKFFSILFIIITYLKMLFIERCS